MIHFASTVLGFIEENISGSTVCRDGPRKKTMYVGGHMLGLGESFQIPGLQPLSPGFLLAMGLNVFCFNWRIGTIKEITCFIEWIGIIDCCSLPVIFFR